MHDRREVGERAAGNQDDEVAVMTEGLGWRGGEALRITTSVERKVSGESVSSPF